MLTLGKMTVHVNCSDEYFPGLEIIANLGLMNSISKIGNYETFPPKICYICIIHAKYRLLPVHWKSDKLIKFFI